MSPYKAGLPLTPQVAVDHSKGGDSAAEAKLPSVTNELKQPNNPHYSVSHFA